MDTENIRGKRLDTVLMELLGLVIAYNLVAQFRRQAVKQGQVTPRPEFQGRVAFVYLSPAARTAPEFRGMAEEIRNRSGKRVQTPFFNRPQPRSDPRISHPRCQKTTKAQKLLRKNKPQISGD
jgi:hypothetical protein